MTKAFYFTIAQDHPSIAGHFDNNPVVPGAIIIDEIIQGILSLMPNKAIVSLSFVKFLLPVIPGSTIQVNIEHKNNNRLQFECLFVDNIVATGRFNLDE